MYLDQIMQTYKFDATENKAMRENLNLKKKKSTFLNPQFVHYRNMKFIFNQLENQNQGRSNNFDPTVKSIEQTTSIPYKPVLISMK